MIVEVIHMNLHINCQIHEKLVSLEKPLYPTRIPEFVEIDQSASNCIIFNELLHVYIQITQGKSNGTL